MKIPCCSTADTLEIEARHASVNFFNPGMNCEYTTNSRMKPNETENSTQKRNDG